MIGDASIIGLDCESGVVDDCNDGTEESVPVKCSGIFIAPEKTTKCSSQCELGTRNKPDPDSTENLSANHYWLYWKSLA